MEPEKNVIKKEETEIDIKELISLIISTHGG